LIEGYLEAFTIMIWFGLLRSLTDCSKQRELVGYGSSRLNKDCECYNTCINTSSSQQRQFATIESKFISGLGTAPRQGNYISRKALVAAVHPKQSDVHNDCFFSDRLAL
jgi:hypothetical protein